MWFYEESIFVLNLHVKNLTWELTWDSNVRSHVRSNMRFMLVHFGKGIISSIFQYCVKINKRQFTVSSRKKKSVQFKIMGMNNFKPRSFWLCEQPWHFPGYLARSSGPCAAAWHCSRRRPAPAYFLCPWSPAQWPAAQRIPAAFGSGIAVWPPPSPVHIAAFVWSACLWNTTIQTD